jgi:Holliday junction resolvasome RuvABC endonuclease subunit
VKREINQILLLNLLATIMGVIFGKEMNHELIYKLYTKTVLYHKNYGHGDGAKQNVLYNNYRKLGNFLNV